MQHPTLTLIIRYPNDTLHLASQDHLKTKVIVKCAACEQMDVVERKQREYLCKKCGAQDKVHAVNGVNCRRQNCNGELKLVMMATGLMMYECSLCDFKEIVNLR